MFKSMIKKAQAELQADIQSTVKNGRSLRVRENDREAITEKQVVEEVKKERKQSTGVKRRLQSKPRGTSICKPKPSVEALLSGAFSTYLGGAKKRVKANDTSNEAVFLRSVPVKGVRAEEVKKLPKIPTEVYYQLNDEDDGYGQSLLRLIDRQKGS